MTKLLLHWFLSAVCLIVVAKLIPGFVVRSFVAALFAAAAIGFINATLGFILKILTFPLTIVTLGLFFLVINALMLELAAYFVPGFDVRGFWPAFLGALILSVLHLFVRRLVKEASR